MHIGYQLPISQADFRYNPGENVEANSALSHRACDTAGGSISISPLIAQCVTRKILKRLP